MQPQPAAQDGGTREVLESIVIPPVPNQPFSATLQTEWIRYTGEGGTITLVNERPIVRDSKGRIYQERWGLVPKFGKVNSQRMLIRIADPAKHTLYAIDVGTIGNDQPLTAMSEIWHSQELAINLLSIRIGPMIGKKIFNITELSASEPAPELF